MNFTVEETKMLCLQAIFNTIYKRQKEEYFLFTSHLTQKENSAEGYTAELFNSLCVKIPIDFHDNQFISLELQIGQRETCY